MSYVVRSSSASEVVLHRARFPAVYHLVSWLWLLLLGVLLIGIVVFVQREVRAWSTEMAVTNQRVVLKEGLFSLRTEELPLAKIEEINLRQSFLGRLFGYGSISIRGTGEGSIRFPTAQSPVRFRAAIEQARTDVRAVA